MSKIVETAYQKTKSFDKLSFLYLVTGNSQRLGMMQTIAQKRGDNMSRFQNALFLGDVAARVAVLRETGQCEYFYGIQCRSDTDIKILSPTTLPRTMASTTLHSTFSRKPA